MSIYSKCLGALAFAQDGTDHLLYTVPAGGGPAIIKSVVTRADPASYTVVYVHTLGSDNWIAYNRVLTGGLIAVTSEAVYIPLQPGDTIHAYGVGGAGLEGMAIIGGYQFETP